MEAFWRILTLPTGAGYIATDRRSGGGATPVGLILSQSAADSCDILTLCVRPAFRRRGIATRLLDTMMTDRATVGASEIFLEAADDNQAATKFYEKNGFFAVGRRAGYYRHEDAAMDAIVYRSRLNSARDDE